MNELDNLKPEVRGAFVVLARAGIKNDALWVEACNIIHAELVRLADQARTNLDMAACMDLLRRDCIAAGAISESVPPMFYSEAVITLHRRAERAESELAALKRRIAEAPTAVVKQFYANLTLEPFDPPAWALRDKPVRLLLDE